MTIKSGMVFAPSPDIVVRMIEEELIIVPLTSGIGDLEDELFTLNETGKVIWEYLDGKHTIAEIIDILNQDFDAQDGEIEKDVLGLVEELEKRKILIEINNSGIMDNQLENIP
jgi:coenzyme PQQ biosynthesis protein PqqD